ncbi:MAG: SGNH/GDSL hydrolase family protein [Chlamydiota bacterium]|nr:SGNH/GDSL hydrolase family protein [Chlamydiota bacterium]
MKKRFCFALIGILSFFCQFHFLSSGFADISLNGRTSWWMVWSDFEGTNGNLRYSMWLNGQWSSVQDVFPGSSSIDHSPSVAVGADGKTVISFIRQDDAGGSLYVSRWNGKNFEPAQKIIGSSDMMFRSPCISLDQDGLAWIAAIGYEGTMDNIYLFRESKSGTWEKTQISISDAYPDIDPAIIWTQEHALVVWSAYDGKNYRLFSRYWNGKTWSDESVLAATSGNGADEFPSLFLQQGKISAAWKKAQKNAVSFWEDGAWSGLFMENIYLWDNSYLHLLSGVHSAQVSFGWFETLQSKGTLKAILLETNATLAMQGKASFSLKKIAKFFSVGLREAYAGGIPNKYTAFGDSITLGVDGNGVTYPHQLEVRLDVNVEESDVVNRGVGGETTAAGLDRINGVLISDNPEYVLIMEGTNDVTAGRHRSVVGFNLEEMVVRAKNLGVNPILATIPPRHSGDSLQKGMPQYNETVRDVATSQGIPLCDIFAEMMAMPGLDSLFSDARIHFGGAGLDVIAEIWFQTILSVKGGGSKAPTSKGGGCGTISAGSGGIHHLNLEIPFLMVILLVSRRWLRLKKVSC